MTSAKLLNFRRQAQRLAEQLFPATLRLGDNPALIEAASSGIKQSQVLDEAGGGYVWIRAASFSIAKVRLGNVAPKNNARLFWSEENIFVRVLDVTDAGPTDPVFLVRCEALTA